MILELSRPPAEACQKSGVVLLTQNRVTPFGAGEASKSYFLFSGMAESGILALFAQIIVMVVFLSILLLFIGVGILMVSHVCVVTRVFCQGRFGRVAEDRYGLEGGRQGGLSPENLGMLPCFEFKAETVMTEDCVVCLERFQLGDRCRLLPECGHSFHGLCVDSWLLIAPACPICRTPVTRSCRRQLQDDAEQVVRSRNRSELGVPVVRPAVTGLHPVL